jgi:hypothetical protein
MYQFSECGDSFAALAQEFVVHKSLSTAIFRHNSDIFRGTGPGRPLDADKPPCAPAGASGGRPPAVPEETGASLLAKFHFYQFFYMVNSLGRG